MPENKKERTLFSNGEQLVENVTKKSGFGKPSYPREYEEAKEIIKGNIVNIKSHLSEVPESKKLDEVIITVRMNEKFLAKSYAPSNLFRDLNLEEIGSRNWNTTSSNSKMFFCRTKQTYLDKAFEKIDNPSSNNFKEDLQKVEKIDLLNFEEIVQGFGEDWSEGRVEFVLHPVKETDELIEKFMLNLRHDHSIAQDIKVRKYDNGPIFVSGVVDKRTINNFKDFNPLRTVHPMRFNMRKPNSVHSNNVVSQIQNHYTKPNYQPPLIKVGVIDGGIDKNNTFINDFTSQKFEVPNPPSNGYKEHGTGVTGLILYGNLDQYTSHQTLPVPFIEVESIRALPTSNPDVDLYEAIDLVEEVVPQQDDIPIYNISFGPGGEILDDAISRFTFSLDQLSYRFNKLFIVAVGNDGLELPPHNRIQSPADLVNGLGVGAYSIDTTTGEFKRASYSSIGYGREGAKIKPDVLDFGGDDNLPIKLFGDSDFTLLKDQGTSYASPLVARKAAYLMASNEKLNHMISRALLIHNADNFGKESKEVGHGFIDSNVSSYLESTESKVTVFYDNEISTKKYAKIPLTIPNDFDAKYFNIKWTIVTETQINPLSTESYTYTSIEDTFYPHNEKYRLKATINGKDKSRTLNTLKDRQRISTLLNDGWKKSSLPVSRAGQFFLTEEERRKDFKWDTVIKKEIQRIKRKSLKNPFIIVHGLDRNDSIERIKYAIVVTIEAVESEEDLYTSIELEYPILQPLSLRNQTRIRT